MYLLINVFYMHMVKDHRQITFVTLNGFSPLSKNLQPPVPNGQYQGGCNTKKKKNKKYTPVLNGISSFEGTS